MYGYYTDHLYIASVDGLPEYTGDTVTSAIILYVDILPRLKSGEDVNLACNKHPAPNSLVQTAKSVFPTPQKSEHRYAV